MPSLRLYIEITKELLKIHFSLTFSHDDEGDDGENKKNFHVDFGHGRSGLQKLLE